VTVVSGNGVAAPTPHMAASASAASKAAPTAMCLAVLMIVAVFVCYDP
jgi:hypothetical protein